MRCVYMIAGQHRNESPWIWDRDRDRFGLGIGYGIGKRKRDLMTIVDFLALIGNGKEIFEHACCFACFFGAVRSLVPARRSCWGWDAVGICGCEGFRQVDASRVGGRACALGFAGLECFKGLLRVSATWHFSKVESEIVRGS